MLYRTRLVAVAVLVVLALVGCSKSSDEAENKDEPAKVESIEGSDAKKIVLTPEADGRIGIKAVQVTEAPAPPGQPTRKAVPYAAILYDEKGQTSVYTSPAAQTFVRAPVTVDRIDGDSALLSEGPPAGTWVVTVGAAELLGAETGVGED